MNTTPSPRPALQEIVEIVLPLPRYHPEAVTILAKYILLCNPLVYRVFIDCRPLGRQPRGPTVYVYAYPNVSAKNIREMYQDFLKTRPMR
jgi:hypothetical protein